MRRSRRKSRGSRSTSENLQPMSKESKVGNYIELEEADVKKVRELDPESPNHGLRLMSDYGGGYIGIEHLLN